MIRNLFAAVILAGFSAIISGTAFADGDLSLLHQAAKESDTAEESDDIRPQIRVSNKKWNYGAWSLVKTDDEFDGISYNVYSDGAKPDTPLDFPFHNTMAFLNLYCGESDIFMFVVIENGRLFAHQSFYGTSRARVRFKFDDTAVKRDTWHLSESWRLIYPQSNESNFIRRIIEHKTLVLELSMFGNTLRRFRFDLNGSAMAIAELRKKCG